MEHPNHYSDTLFPANSFPNTALTDDYKYFVASLVHYPFVMLDRSTVADSILKRSLTLSASTWTRQRIVMRSLCRLVLILSAVIAPFVRVAWAQDSPSLGDLARQQRQQKEQSKAAPGKDPKTSKIITNEEMPSRMEPQSVRAVSRGNYDALPAAQNEPKQPAEHWKSQIIAQKNQIATLQRQVDELSESIRFAPANCAANCVGWNERQREKQQRVESMQSQLEEEKRRLEDLQDSARKQGYGSSVYDP